MKDGIYHVAFSAGGQNSGQGIVVVKSGAVNGGDTGYLFTGGLSGPDGAMTASIKVDQWNPSAVSIFGPLRNFALTLAGRGDDAKGSFQIHGSVDGHPNQKISIDGKYLSPAV